MSATELVSCDPSPWTLCSSLAHQMLQDVDISVVVTLYNYEEYVCECLESLVAAIRYDSTLNVEVIVVDDASTDAGPAVVKEMALTHPDMPLLLVQKLLNGGLSQARNLGLRLSRGAAAFILDADNLIKPACLSELYVHLRKTGAAAVYPCIEKFSSSDQRIVGTVSDRPFDLTQLLVANYIDAMAMFSVDSLFGVGLYDVGMIHGWEDYDIWLSFGFAGLRVESHPSVLASYRVHADSMLNRLTEHALEVGRYLYLKHRKSLPMLPEDAVLFGSLKKLFYTPDSTSDQSVSP